VFSLRDKVVVVTGGASGIGAATSRRLAAAGATCVIVDLTKADDLAGEVGGRSVICDVTDQESVVTVVAHTIDHYGRIDIMVNNAGILGPGGGLTADSMAATRTVLDVNLLGVIHGTKAAAAVMEPGGSIINTASMAGIVGFPGLSAYGASKWGVVGFTKHSAIELGPRGIRVNCVCPTGVDTPMADTGEGAAQAAEHWAVKTQSLANQHLNRLATADEVAAAIHFLASDDAMMVNGHALAVDGGLGAGLSVQLIEELVGQPIHDSGGIIE
jgi:3alpha(or 20beta)-hydroxysteroid dehydrogenase